MGVSAWVWVAGLAVSVAGVAAVMQAVNAWPPSSAAHGSAGGGVSRKVDALARAALQEIQLRSWTVDSVAGNEADLEKQAGAGKAALAVITLKENKERLAKYDAKVAAAMEKLKAEEGATGKLAAQLDEFCRYTERVSFQYHLSLKYYGYTPKTMALHADLLRIKSPKDGGISLDDVRGGRYESEVMRRIDAERQEMVERFRRESGAR